MQTLNIVICEDGKDAADKGHVYHEGFTEVAIEKVVVVKDGTVEGNSTVDFVMQDSNGKKYMFMLTGNLLRSIPFFSKKY